ncbi:phosphoribosylglycinamide formyltransferase [Ramicandelaber brevisporus]|nr:phosphoribosylglycinamide formyltransferase [Ramicandelaber brevisporus]
MTDTSVPKRLVVLISGSGTNLQALIDACSSGLLPNCVISLVISNRKAAFGLERARRVGIPTLYHNLKAYTDRGQTREDYDVDLARLICTSEHLGGSPPDLVVLAGFMHILSEKFLLNMPSDNVCGIINLHPALPGQFNGAHAIERAFKAFEEGEITQTGVMVNKVIKEVDEGDPVVQEVVPLHPGDTLEVVEERIHAVEHRIIVDAVRIMLKL